MYGRNCKCKKAPSNIIRRDAALLSLKPCYSMAPLTLQVFTYLNTPRMRMSNVPQELCGNKQATILHVLTPTVILGKRKKLSLPQEKWKCTLRETKGCQDGDIGLFHWNYLTYHFCQNKFRYP